MDKTTFARRLRGRTAFILLLAFLSILPLEIRAGYLYVLNDDPDAGSRIYGFQVNESTGALTPLAGFPVATGGTGGTGLVCERMAIDIVNRRIFVVNDNSDSVSAFSINPSTGALTALPFSPLVIGTGTWNAMAVHPSGSPLIISNGATGAVGAVSLNITATTATPAAGSPFTLGGATAFSNTFSIDGNFYYSGGNNGNNFAGFSVDAASGVLTPLPGSPFATGITGPLAYAMDSAGRLFTVNATDFAVRIYATTAGVPAAVTGNPFASGLTQRRDGLLHPSGNFYIVAGNSGNNVGVFQIAGSGAGTTVAPVAGSPFATGGTTANVLATNQAGTFLFVGNRLSRNLTTFAFNTSTGVLSGQTVQSSNTFGTTGAVNGIGYLPDQIAATGNIGGRVVDGSGNGLGNVVVQLSGGPSPVIALTNPFGYYYFSSVTTGVSYTLTPSKRAYVFTPPTITFNHIGDVSNHDFTATF